MGRNLGNADRIIRVVVGVVALVGAFGAGIGSVGGVVLLLVGAIMLGTAAVGFCPLYRVLGLSTRPVQRVNG
jgi:Inner membrane protein YgaP-like, transmembrane domain